MAGTQQVIAQAAPIAPPHGCPTVPLAPLWPLLAFWTVASLVLAVVGAPLFRPR